MIEPAHAQHHDGAQYLELQRLPKVHTVIHLAPLSLVMKVV